MVHQLEEQRLAESFELTEGRERYWNQVEELRSSLGISHAEARSRWSDYYERGGKPKKIVKKIVLSVKASRTDSRTCPFCRDSIYHPDEGGPDYVCTSCQAHYHLDCFEDELGGCCATLGCSTRRVIAQARARIRTRGHRIPVVTRDPVVERDLRQLDEDPEHVQTQRRAPVEPARAAQEAQEQEQVPAPTPTGPGLLERLQEWWEALGERWATSGFRESIRRDGPVLLGVAGLLLLVVAICWLVVLGIAG
jgi:hypothetical protein